MRVRSIGVVEKSKARRSPIARVKSFAKPHEFAESYFERKRIRAAVYRREELPTGARLRVPCIVIEYSGTTLIPDRATARPDSFGNVVIDVQYAGS